MTNEIILAIIASGGFWAVVNTLVTMTMSGHKKENDTIRLLKEADVAILHDKIYHQCKIALEAGEISADDYHNLDTLIKPYFALGGNGTAHKLWEDVQELPIKN